MVMLGNDLAMVDPLDRLPIELVDQISRNLSVEDRLRCRRLSSRWDRTVLALPSLLTSPPAFGYRYNMKRTEQFEGLRTLLRRSNCGYIKEIGFSCLPFKRAPTALEFTGRAADLEIMLSSIVKEFHLRVHTLRLIGFKDVDATLRLLIEALGPVSIELPFCMFDPEAYYLANILAATRDVDYLQVSGETALSNDRHPGPPDHPVVSHISSLRWGCDCQYLSLPLTYNFAEHFSFPCLTSLNLQECILDMSVLTTLLTQNLKHLKLQDTIGVDLPEILGYLSEVGSSLDTLVIYEHPDQLYVTDRRPADDSSMRRANLESISHLSSLSVCTPQDETLVPSLLRAAGSSLKELYLENYPNQRSCYWFAKLAFANCEYLEKVVFQDPTPDNNASECLVDAISMYDLPELETIHPRVVLTCKYDPVIPSKLPGQPRSSTFFNYFVQVSLGTITPDHA